MNITESFKNKTLVITGGTGSFGSTVLKHFLTTELTDYLGVDKATYSDWKNGKTSSYKRYIDKIAEFLDSSYDYILDGKEADPDEMELLRLYRNLTKEKKAQLLLVAQTI